jgi:chitinase
MKLAFGLGLALVGFLAAQDSVSAAAQASCGSCTGCLWTYSGGSQCFTDAVEDSCDAWGDGYTWCAGGSTTTTAPTTQPTTSAPTTEPATTTTSTPGSSSFVYSPYIDLGMGTGSTIVSRMDSVGLNAITLAFATGECGSETWAGSAASTVVSVIDSLVAAKKKYIISTGGAAGTFTCSSDSSFLTFIETYASDYLVGIDFDIEGGQTQSEIDSLVQRAKNAQSTYPNLRYSFTVASLGQSAGGDPLGTTGAVVIEMIKSNALSNYLINLMAMDYGSAGQYVCVVSDGACEMGESANQAAKNLNSYYSIPFSQIELTVMIGGNDVESNVFTIDDVATVSNFATQSSLAGVHFWSFDRDQDCAAGAASASCNSYGLAGSLGFTTEFASYLQ